MTTSNPNEDPEIPRAGDGFREPALEDPKGEAGGVERAKRERRTERWLWLLGTLAVLIGAFFLFRHLFFRPVSMDLHGHLDSVRRFHRGRAGLPGNALYYVLVYACAGFTGRGVPLLTAGTIVLTLATAARFAVDYRLLARRGDQPGVLAQPQPSARPWLVLLIALAVTVSFSLPTPGSLRQGWWYLGQTPPNVWHNSTTILLMPLAVALFWTSYRSLRAPTLGSDIGIAVLAVLNILAKPSFFLVLAPTYSVILLAHHGLGRRFWARIWPIAVGGAALAAQYYVIFTLQHASRQPEESHVTIDPFAAWSAFAPNIPFAILASVVFPLLYMLVYRGALRREPLVLYALALYGVSLLMMALLAETGPRFLHGNFFWQTFVCNHMLFLATARQLVLRVRDAGWGTREAIAAFGLALHAVMGLAYLARMVRTPNFL